MALPNPSFEPKTHRRRPGAVAPSREVPSRRAQFLAKNSQFSPKTALVRVQNSRKRRQTAATLHVRLDFLVTNGPLVPSNSTICPKNGPKRRQKAPKTAQCAPTPRNQERAESWATWLENEFRGHLVHPQPPTYYGFQASESPTETRRPLYQWSLGAAGGPASPRIVGANGGSTRVPRAKKIIFPKLFLDHLGYSNKCFWAVLNPWWRVLGHEKSQNALKMGLFKTNNRSKMGQKRVFRKVILDHWGWSNKCFEPSLSPL